MPSKNPVIVALRGDEAYARYLDRLLKAVRATGARIDSRTRLTEYALTVLGAGLGLKSPPRVRPVGTNRHGEPKPQ